jgi:PilZ domain
MTFLDDLAAKMGLRERRRGGRVPTGGVEVSYRAGAEEKSAKIVDVSPSGIYLTAMDSISPGTEVSLTLRKKTPMGTNLGAQVRLRAKVARVDQQGVGLEFLHEGIDGSGWEHLVVKAAELSPKSDGVRVFRVAKALAYVLRISPQIEGQFLKIITDTLNPESAERAIEIVLKADELLSSKGQKPKTGVDMSVVQRILEYGSKGDTHEEDVEECWIGLLATSSMQGTDDRISLKFVLALSRLDVVSLRILKTGCNKAREVGWGAGFAFPQSLTCAAQEIKKITGVRDLPPIEWGLNRLHDLGLMELTPKSAAFEPITQINITPTGLGLKLFARCSGQLNVPEAHGGGSTAG